MHDDLDRRRPHDDAVLRQRVERIAEHDRYDRDAGRHGEAKCALPSPPPVAIPPFPARRQLPPSTAAGMPSVNAGARLPIASTVRSTASTPGVPRLWKRRTGQPRLAAISVSLLLAFVGRGWP